MKRLLGLGLLGMTLLLGACSDLSELTGALEEQSIVLILAVQPPASGDEPLVNARISVDDEGELKGHVLIVDKGREVNLKLDEGLSVQESVDCGGETLFLRATDAGTGDSYDLSIRPDGEAGEVEECLIFDLSTGGVSQSAIVPGLLDLTQVCSSR